MMGRNWRVLIDISICHVYNWMPAWKNIELLSWEYFTAREETMVGLRESESLCLQVAFYVAMSCPVGRNGWWASYFFIIVKALFHLSLKNQISCQCKLIWNPILKSLDKILSTKTKPKLKPIGLKFQTKPRADIGSEPHLKLNRQVSTRISTTG